tara:strand:+ start:484 stop:633 length:150 start_codon:yes stop_codon:yes gene_type:complete
MSDYPYELMDEHAKVCLQMQTIEELPQDERLEVERRFELLTKEIHSYCF